MTLQKKRQNTDTSYQGHRKITQSGTYRQTTYITLSQIKKQLFNNLQALCNPGSWESHPVDGPISMCVRMTYSAAGIMEKLDQVNIKKEKHEINTIIMTNI